MKQKQRRIVLLTVVLVGMVAFLFLRQSKPKVSNLEGTQYTWVALPTDASYSVTLEDGKNMTSDAYQRYVTEKGYENKTGMVALLETTSIITDKMTWHIKATPAEMSFELKYNGKTLEDGDVLEIRDEASFKKLEKPVYQKQFDTWVRVDGNVEMTGTIDFTQVGTYPVSFTLNDKKQDIEVRLVEDVESENSVDEYGPTMLVTRERGLPSDYIPDLMEVPADYAVSEGYRATPRSTQAFIEMVDAMYEETGMWMYVTSGYRSYETQERLYTNYIAESGQEEADRFSAPPGHSEHQTGLVMDVVTPGGYMDDFGLTQQSAWVNKNAHRFGYIIRYPEGKEHITGYMPEAWHLRYIGDIAPQVYESGLTYDEWYAQNME